MFDESTVLPCDIKVVPSDSFQLSLESVDPQPSWEQENPPRHNFWGSEPDGYISKGKVCDDGAAHLRLHTRECITSARPRILLIRTFPQDIGAPLTALLTQWIILQKQNFVLSFRKTLL